MPRRLRSRGTRLRCGTLVSVHESCSAWFSLQGDGLVCTPPTSRVPTGTTRDVGSFGPIPHSRPGREGWRGGGRPTSGTRAGGRSDADGTSSTLTEINTKLGQHKRDTSRSDNLFTSRRRADVFKECVVTGVMSYSVVGTAVHDSQTAGRVRTS